MDPLHNLDAFVPGLVRRQWASAPPRPDVASRAALEGVVLFADISGFSTLMESQSRLGRAGAETFGRALGGYFDQLVTRIGEHGGDPISFAGDAVLAVWVPEPGEGLGDAVARAAACARVIQADVSGHVFDGGLRLALRVAIGCGPAEIVLVGGIRGRRYSLVVGDAVEQVGPLLAAGRRGDVVISERARVEAGVRITGDPLPGGLRVTAVRAPGPRAFVLPPIDPSARASLLALVPPVVQFWASSGTSELIGERRRIQSMFVALPPMDLSDPGWLDACHASVRRVQAVVDRLGGEVSDVIADDKGFVLLAQWGLPTMSNEDGAERALRAALEIHDTLRAHAHWASIGLSTGYCFCGLIGNERRACYTTYGEKVNLASRLMGEAQGAPLCDQATRDAAGERVRFEARAPVKVKGFPEPIAVFRPLGLRAAGARVSVPGTVDRDVERARIRSRVERLAEGRGGVLLLQGEAGIGKSVLLSEARRAFAAARVPTLAGEGRAADRNTPYHALRGVVTELLEVRLPIELGELSRRVQELFADDPEQLERAPLLNDVLALGLPENERTRSLSDQARSDNLAALLVRLLGRRAAAGPLGVTLEDAHWFDSASWALVRILVGSAPGVLWVMTTRPIATPRPPELDTLVAMPDTEVLNLETLSPELLADVVAQQLGVRRIPAPVQAVVAGRAQGNPYFAQEIALALLDAKVLRKVEDGLEVVSVTDLEAFPVPATVQDVIISRLDRLPAEVQLVLKVASVLGRSFTVADVARVAPGHPSAEQVSAWLDGIDLVEPAAAGGYEFRHILARDAIYDALLLAQRRELHRAVVEHCEAGGVEAPPGVLAWHAEAAEDWTRAVAYLERAGAQALERAGPRECLRLLGHAIELADAHGVGVADERRADWLLDMSEAAFRLGDPATCTRHGEEAFRRLGIPLPTSAGGEAMALLGLVWSRQLGRTPRQLAGPGLSGERLVRILAIHGRMIDAYGYQLRVPAMLLAVMRLLALAQAANDAGREAQGWLMLHFVLVVTPMREWSLRRFFARSRARLDAVEDLALRALVTVRVAVGLYYERRWDESEALAREALAYAERAGDLRQQMECLVNLGFVLSWVGRFAEVDELARRALEIQALTDDEQLRVFATLARVESHVFRGMDAEAERLVEEVADAVALRAQPANAIRGLGLRALVHARRKDPRARASAEEALAALDREQYPVGWMLPGIIGVSLAFLALWAEARRTGAPEAAALAALTRRAVKKTDWFSQMYPFGASFREVLHAALLAGEGKPATRAFTRAVAHARESGMRYAEALALEGLAGCGGPEAEAHRREAEVLYTALGAVREGGLNPVARSG